MGLLGRLDLSLVPLLQLRSTLVALRLKLPLAALGILVQWMPPVVLAFLSVLLQVALWAVLMAVLMAMLTAALKMMLELVWAVRVVRVVRVVQFVRVVRVVRAARAALAAAAAQTKTAAVAVARVVLASRLHDTRKRYSMQPMSVLLRATKAAPLIRRHGSCHSP